MHVLANHFLPIQIVRGKVQLEHISKDIPNAEGLAGNVIRNR